MKKFLLILMFCCCLPIITKAQIKGLDVQKIQQKARQISDNEYKNMDKNGDGEVSKKEYMDYVMKETYEKNEMAFKQIDQNGDGSVSKAEYEDFMNFATSKMNEFMQMMGKGK